MAESMQTTGKEAPPTGIKGGQIAQILPQTGKTARQSPKEYAAVVARTQVHKARMLESLARTHGIVYLAAQLAGISRETHRRYCKKDKVYAAKAEEFREDDLDLAEAVVQPAIAQQKERPDLALRAAMFKLENQGKARGYGKQADVAVNVSQGFQLNIIKPDEKKKEEKQE